MINVIKSFIDTRYNIVFFTFSNPKFINFHSNVIIFRFIKIWSTLLTFHPKIIVEMVPPPLRWCKWSAQFLLYHLSTWTTIPLLIIIIIIDYELYYVTNMFMYLYAVYIVPRRILLFNFSKYSIILNFLTNLWMVASASITNCTRRT